MLYREVPRNGDKLSVLGYGCMRLPVRRRSIDEKLAEKQILYALDQGVNYFDTAVPYHNGKSEPFPGKVFSTNGYRDKVKIATNDLDDQAYDEGQEKIEKTKGWL